MDPVNDIARQRSLFIARGKGKGKFWLRYNKIYLIPYKGSVVSS